MSNVIRKQERCDAYADYIDSIAEVGRVFLQIPGATGAKLDYIAADLDASVERLIVAQRKYRLWLGTEQ